jgi:two-component system response regulator CpxR
VLLIEDDRELTSLMAVYLSRHGFTVDVVHDGRQGLARALSERNDLVILDVMLPHVNGMEVLRYVRRRSRIPIIILTARGSADDRVAGLRGGADDYLCKPFEPNELLARIEAVLRRSGHTVARPGEMLEGQGVTLSVSHREVRAHGQRIELTAVEFDLLELLMRSAGRVVSRDEITAILYQREATPYERSLDVHVSHLRHKLDDSGAALIRAVRGVGYVFRSE